MRHRASRPLIDQWRRLPRAAARPIGAAAKVGPVRAAAVILALLGAGTTAFVTVAASGSDDSSADGDSRVTALADRGSTTSRAGERLTLGPESEAASPTDRSAGTRPTVEPEPTDADETAEPTPTPTEVLVEASEAATSPTPPPTPPPTPSPDEATTSASAPEDHEAPETSLSEDYPDGRTAVFSFSADETASFACSLDGGAWTACTSPTTYSDLDAGWHDFAVRAIDEAGNVDPSPAETRWQANGAPGSGD